jgi:hypothetical protein
MAPTSANLSPAELSYLHKSLSQTPPIRPDGRSPTQFRPLVAESEILPSANGSARICFADGTEAVVGIKAEVEKSAGHGRDYAGETEKDNGLGTAGGAEIEMGGMGEKEEGRKGRDAWVEVQIEMAGYRDDDALPVFLGAMLRESLLATEGLKDRLYINRRFHWRLYIDVRSSSTVARRRLLTHKTDSTPLRAAILPSASPLTNHTPRSTTHTAPSTHLRARRRPSVQRRLGSCRTPLHIRPKAPRHTPPSLSRPEYPLRPQRR